MTIDNNKLYVQMSKEQIDKYLEENDYRSGFGLLILVLERLNSDEKVELINYYSENLNDIISKFRC